jgi:hypothetical protein
MAMTNSNEVFYIKTGESQKRKEKHKFLENKNSVQLILET